MKENSGLRCYPVRTALWLILMLGIAGSPSEGQIPNFGFTQNSVHLQNGLSIVGAPSPAQINDNDDVAATYADVNGGNHAAILQRNTAVQQDLRFPASVMSQFAIKDFAPTAVNDAGVVAGWYTRIGDANMDYPRSGFTWDGQKFTPIQVLGSKSTQVNAINLYGEVAGWYTAVEPNSQGGPVLVYTRGFIHNGSGFQFVEIEHKVSEMCAQQTWIAGMNDKGHVTGSFIDYSLKSDGKYYCEIKGFLRTEQGTQVFTIPGTGRVEPTAINNFDDVVGYYFVPNPAPNLFYQEFRVAFFKSGIYYRAFPPAAINPANPGKDSMFTGVNDRRVVIGRTILANEQPQSVLFYGDPISAGAPSSKLAEGLTLQVSSPAPKANIPVTVSFSVTNATASIAVVPYFLVGARDPLSKNVDFPASPQVTLQPGQSYSYSFSKVFANPGNYTLWPALFNGLDWEEIGPRRTINIK